MKDPTGEILTAFVTAISGNVTYNGTAWHVYKEEPPKGKRNYIYIASVLLDDQSDKDHDIFYGTVIINISVKKDKYCRIISNSLSNTIIQLVTELRLSMTSYNMSLKLHNPALVLEVETPESNFVKTLQINFTTQEK